VLTDHLEEVVPRAGRDGNRGRGWLPRRAVPRR